MRIAMIGQRGLPATFGGIERHVEELGARLAARGHDVTVYCRPNYVDRPRRTYRGMTLRDLPVIPTKHLEALSHSGVSTLSAIARGADVVHYHALGPGIWSPLPRWLSRAAVVQTIHGLDDQRAKWSRSASALLGVARSLSARVPDATVTVSRALQRIYREQHDRPTWYVPNGVVPRSHRTPDEITRRFGLHGDDYLLFVGRLVPEKAPDVLLSAFAQVDTPLRLVVVGGSSFTDSYVDQLRRQASNDPRVLLPGYLYGDVLDELYTNARAFVLPSRLEGLPLTLLEAMSCPTPVIASDIPPHTEVLDHLAGPGAHLVPVGDAQVLAGTLKALLAASSQDEHAGARRLRDAVLADHDWDVVTDETEAVYRAVVRGGTGC